MVQLTVKGIGEVHTYVSLPSTKKYCLCLPGMIHGGISVLNFDRLPDFLPLKETELNAPTEYDLNEGNWPNRRFAHNIATAIRFNRFKGVAKV